MPPPGTACSPTTPHRPTPQSGHDDHRADFLNRSPAVVVRAVAADNASMKISGPNNSSNNNINCYCHYSYHYHPTRRGRRVRRRDGGCGGGVPGYLSFLPLLLLRRLLRRRLRSSTRTASSERNGGRASRLLLDDGYADDGRPATAFGRPSARPCRCRRATGRWRRRTRRSSTGSTWCAPACGLRRARRRQLRGLAGLRALSGRRRLERASITATRPRASVSYSYDKKMGGKLYLQMERRKWSYLHTPIGCATTINACNPLFHPSQQITHLKVLFLPSLCIHHERTKRTIRTFFFL